MSVFCGNKSLQKVKNLRVIEKYCVFFHPPYKGERYKLAGNKSWKIVFPLKECINILPPCKRIICLDRLKPIPDPVFLVVKKGTKILSTCSCSIPQPLSITSIFMLLNILLALNSIVELFILITVSFAFKTRLIRICSVTPFWHSFFNQLLKYQKRS